MVAPFPLAMLAVVWWKRGQLSWKRDLVPLVPFFLVAGSFGLVTLYVERTFLGATGREFEFSFLQRCLIAGRALWFYFGKALLPINLVFSYPRWNISTSSWWQYLFPVAAVAAGGIVWAMRKVSRAPTTVLVIFTAMLSPCLGFFNLYTFRYSFVADHYQYLAIIGPIAAAAAIMAKAASHLGKRLRRTAQPLLGGVLLLGLLLMSQRQSRAYADAWTLYRTTIRDNPNCWMAYNNLGLLFADLGQADLAQVNYEKALALNPKDADAQYNLGLVLARTGRTEEAMGDFQKALKLNPNHANAHNNLGALLERQGQTAEAMEHYERALENYRDHAEAHNNIGVLLEKMGRSDEAMDHFAKALEVNPDYRDAHYNLGLFLANMGRTDDAVTHFQRALELDPNYVKAHNSLGVLFAQAGRIDEAIEHFRKALDVEPDSVGTLSNLARALAQKGQLADAIAILQKALTLAKSRGDEAQQRWVEQFLERIYQSAGAQ